MSPGRVCFGTAGWSYPDWEGAVYPPDNRDNRLALYTFLFDLVEVNATFYKVLPVKVAENWLKTTAPCPDFRFVIKAWQGLTHHDKPAPREISRIRDFLKVLAESGRLKSLLCQFPWSFRFNEAALSKVSRLLENFADFPAAVEMRHASWNQPAFLERLAQFDAAFCNIDQPVLPRNLEATCHGAGSLAYVRLHGRNRANWFAENIQGHERYDYYYPAPERAEILSRIHHLAEKADQVLVITNNHYHGQAVANGLLLQQAWEGKVKAIPASLKTLYPELAACRPHQSFPDSATADLFGG